MTIGETSGGFYVSFFNPLIFLTSDLLSMISAICKFDRIGWLISRRYNAPLLSGIQARVVIYFP